MRMTDQVCDSSRGDGESCGLHGVGGDCARSNEGSQIRDAEAGLEETEVFKTIRGDVDR